MRRGSMGFQSESELENELIEQLVSEGYQWVPEVKKVKQR